MGRTNHLFKPGDDFFKNYIAILKTSVRILEKNDNNVKSSRESSVRSPESNKNVTNSKYAFEKMFINYLVHAQTLYWKNHGLEVIWSSHEELPGVLESLYMKKS